MECFSKWNFAQNGMSLKIECYLKLNDTLNRMWLKMECHSKLNVNQNGMSLKMEFQSKWNVNQNIQGVFFLLVLPKKLEYGIFLKYWTGPPQSCLSTRSHVNSFWISLSVKGYKGILYL